jgi:DNA-binding NarL/FixJ family response regulator
VSLGRTPLGRTHPVFRLLSARQRDVAVAGAEGLGDDAIAARMGVAAATIHDHVRVLHRALGTNTRPALVAALSHG